MRRGMFCSLPSPSVGRRWLKGEGMSGTHDRALHFILDWLRANNYRFTTPAPATHARVVARRERARDLRDVFGWSLPFTGDVVAPELAEAMLVADVLEQRGDTF